MTKVVQKLPKKLKAGARKPAEQRREVPRWRKAWPKHSPPPAPMRAKCRHRRAREEVEELAGAVAMARDQPEGQQRAATLGRP